MIKGRAGVQLSAESTCLTCDSRPRGQSPALQSKSTKTELWSKADSKELGQVQQWHWEDTSALDGGTALDEGDSYHKNLRAHSSLFPGLYKVNFKNWEAEGGNTERSWGEYSLWSRDTSSSFEHVSEYMRVTVEALLNFVSEVKSDGLRT